MIEQHRISRLACGLGLLGCLVGLPAVAQDANEPRRRHLGERRHVDEGRRVEIQERIQERFSSMLRNELALSDEQADAVLPAMQELEQSKRERGRERREIAAALQTGMDDGASDGELAAMLDRLEQIDEDDRAAEKSAMEGIDAELSVRQQVKLRFVVHHFRNEIRERLYTHRDRMDRRGPNEEGPRRPERP
jgi:hypothetical protein